MHDLSWEIMFSFVLLLFQFGKTLCGVRGTQTYTKVLTEEFTCEIVVLYISETQRHDKNTEKFFFSLDVEDSFFMKGPLS